MSKFWETEEFEKLNKEWTRKLQDSGFTSIEDQKQRLLNEYDRRTISFDNRDRINEFFSHLGEYVHNNKTLPPLHRQILELYVSGVKIKGKDGIVTKVNRCERAIRYIIKRYKSLLLDL